MNIKIKQHDITDCGAACLASVAAWYKLSLPVSRIRQWAGTDKKGTNAWGIIKAAEKMGLNAKGVKTPSEMIGEIPLPAIAHVITHGKLQHFVVIYRIGAHSIQIMDPATGSMKKMKQESFIEEWTGVLILISPSKDFKARNEKINNLKRFRYLLLPHKNTLMQAVAGAIFFTILGLSTSVYIQKITDHVLLNGNTNLLNLLSLIMLIILIVQIVIGTLQSIFILKTGQLIDGRQP